MSSIHERVVMEIATRQMADSPQLAATVAEYCKLLNDGGFDEMYVESLCQKPWGYFDFYEAWAFLHLHCGLCTGDFVCAEVWVGAGPAKDKEIQENNRRLSRLPSQFRAKFVGGVADDDGRLAWGTDIDLGQILPDQREVRVRVGPSQLPLEVGYTRMSRTFLHMCQDGGVARWPYGHDWIRVYLDPVHHLVRETAGFAQRSNNADARAAPP